MELLPLNSGRRFMDGRLSAEAIAFYFESEDLQMGIFNSNATSFTLQNAAVAINYGAEINTIYQLNKNWQLRDAPPMRTWSLMIGTMQVAIPLMFQKPP